MPLNNEQLLTEIEDLIRTMPPRATLRHESDENLDWLGRLSAVIEQWDLRKAILLSGHLQQFHSNMARDAGEGFRKLMVLLHQARHDLRMKTVGPTTVAVPHGMVFGYFDEIRKIIQLAKEDLLIVDPYLDADFVSLYLPHVSAGVSTRLLSREKLATLLPAVAVFARQVGSNIEVRSAQNFHDRYILLDRTACYQSGASFNAGAKSAPTTITQITDAFSAMLQTYEDLWSRARVER